MTSVRQHEGAFLLLKTPDLVLPDLDAPRSFTIVDIKVVDLLAAASYVDMTSKCQICSPSVLCPGDCRPPRLLWTVPEAPLWRAHESQSGHLFGFHLFS